MICRRLNPLPTEFVTEALRKRYSDCIRKINWKSQETYLLLILEFRARRTSGVQTESQKTEICMKKWQKKIYENWPVEQLSSIAG